MFSSANIVFNFNQILPKATNLQNPNKNIFKKRLDIQLQFNNELTNKFPYL